MRNRFMYPSLLVGLVAVAVGWNSAPNLHIELTKSSPEADTVVERAPETIQLWFSVQPELERSGLGLRGPDGAVQLSKIEQGDDSTAFKATVGSELSEGKYTVSWLAAPYDDHGVRGRFKFTVGAAAER